MRIEKDFGKIGKRQQAEGDDDEAARQKGRRAEGDDDEAARQKGRRAEGDDDEAARQKGRRDERAVVPFCPSALLPAALHQ